MVIKKGRAAMLLKMLASSFGNGVWRIIPGGGGIFGNSNRLLKAR